MCELERRLAAKGKNASWLASELQISRAAVSRWMSGSKRPDKSRVPKLARILGVNELEMTYMLWPTNK